VGAGATPNISVRLHTEAVGGQGTGRLERLTPRDNHSGGTQTVPAAVLFVLMAPARAPDGYKKPSTATSEAAC
jgi:thioredoxin reductase (NADPH)